MGWREYIQKDTLISHTHSLDDPLTQNLTTIYSFSREPTTTYSAALSNLSPPWNLVLVPPLAPSKAKLALTMWLLTIFLYLLDFEYILILKLTSQVRPVTRTSRDYRNIAVIYSYLSILIFWRGC